MAKRVLRPMSLVQLFDEAFDLYKRNFLLFVGIYAVGFVPYYALLFVKPGYRLAGFISGLLLLSVSEAALTWAISRRYLQEPTGVWQSYRAILPVLLPLLLSYWAATAVVTAGFLLCIVPGVILAVWVALLVRVIVVERLAYLTAAKRSKTLIAGYGWRPVIIFTAFLAIVMVVQGTFTMPVDRLVTGRWHSGGIPHNPFLIISRILPSLLTGSLSSICYTLLYYDMRVRKEGFDIDMLAKDIAAQPNKGLAKEASA